jgi:hypothetical protein
VYQIPAALLQRRRHNENGVDAQIFAHASKYCGVLRLHDRSLALGILGISGAKSRLIDEGQWSFVGVCIGVDAAEEPDRITLRIPTNRRVIISEPVLMQPRLAIEDLPREAQVVDNCCYTGLEGTVLAFRIIEATQ